MSVEELRKLASAHFDPSLIVIERAFEARRRADMVQLAQCFAPDATLELVGSSAAHPLFGRAVGIDAIRNLVWAACCAYEWVERTIEDVSRIGGAYVVRRSTRCRNVRTGLLADVRACAVITIKDLEIRTLVDHVDTLAVLKLVSGDGGSLGRFIA